MVIHARQNPAFIKRPRWLFTDRYSITAFQYRSHKKPGCSRAHRKLFEVFSLTSPEKEEDIHG
jgi:hypothetical protein